jgi:hypothetical protein
MQLYEVRFKIEHEDSFEIGKCIVTGNDEDEAIRKATFHLDLARHKRITLNISKLKPQIYQLDRHTIRKEKSMEKAYEGKVRSNYLIAIAAEIYTASKELALNSICRHLKNVSRNPNYKNDIIPLFEMEIEEKCFITQGLQQPYIDKQSIFKEVQFYPN